MAKKVSPAKPAPRASKSRNWLWNLGLMIASAVVVWALVRVWKGSGTEPPAAPQVVSATEPADRFAATVAGPSAPPGPVLEGMVWIPGGEFSMGCEDPRESPHGGPDDMADARPIHRVRVDGFWMDRVEVTNAQFARFVAETGYVTVAERTPTAADFPGAAPENLVAGSTVFTPPAEPVPLDTHYRWWSYIKGANWRHPTGPSSGIDGRDLYPVVQVAYEDAERYAKWAGKRLPTEAEWEFAARGGQAGEPYAWGSELNPSGKWMANTWQGQFPNRDTGQDGFAGIAPGARFPANPYGLYDMAGNVWEWCSDWYRPDAYRLGAGPGGIAINPQGPSSSYDPAEPDQPKRVHRGGSFLCTEQYCTRYMVGTRGKGEVSTASDHLGFRCVKSAK
jgi:formylglycine-generating enzyme required for sulfatase activity